MLTSSLFVKPSFQSSWLGFEINTTYQKLVDVFGEPNSEGDGYKVDAEWILQSNNDLYFTIYNYKTGKNYDSEGQEVEDITDWHIGISQQDDLEKIKELFSILGF